MAESAELGSAVCRLRQTSARRRLAELSPGGSTGRDVRARTGSGQLAQTDSRCSTSTMICINETWNGNNYWLFDSPRTQKDREPNK